MSRSEPMVTTIGGVVSQVHPVRTMADLHAFAQWLHGSSRMGLAVDTETSGLDIFSKGHKLRLVQVGDGRDAWVFEHGAIGRQELELVLSQGALLLHNVTYDLLVLEREGYLNFDEAYGRSFDTYTMAHLLDPRAREDGGTGHRLKDLAARYVADDAPDSDKALTALFKSEGYKDKGEGFAKIALRHPDYVLYAGVDILITYRLAEKLAPLVHELGYSTLMHFEREVARVCAKMERKGILVDQDYARGLEGELYDLGERAAEEAALYGVHNVNSTAQVADALTHLGFELVERTASGKVKVDKAVLQATDHPLAEAIIVAKSAGKWAESYVRGTLNSLDANGRCHPHTMPLRARTGRMAVTNPPLHQLPSNDYRIRRMFIADPGFVIASADYSQVEPRILSVLAEDAALMAMANSGESVYHGIAVQLYGEGYNSKELKLTKNTVLGKVYGGGAATLARQAGVSIPEAEAARKRLDLAFPSIKRYSKRLQERAQHGAKEVVTPSGRRLPLDRDRLYAATNYVCQSTARDVLCEGLLRMDDADLTQYLLLLVHDESLVQVPADNAEPILRAVVEAMQTDFGGVRLAADGDIYGPSWGHGYMPKVPA